MVLFMSLVTGQGTPGRQDFRRFVNDKVLVIGRMGLRGRMGHRLVQEEILRMLVAVLVTRRVRVREKGQMMVVQRMGQESRPGARQGEGRPAAAGADRIPYRRRRRMWRGCPRARRSPVASICGGKRPRLQIVSGAAIFAPSPAGAGIPTVHGRRGRAFCWRVRRKNLSPLCLCTLRF